MTTPDASCPITAGNGTSFRLPSMAFKSLAHKPLAATLTKISPDFGFAISISAILKSLPTSSRTAALIFNLNAPFACLGFEVTPGSHGAKAILLTFLRL